MIDEGNYVDIIAKIASQDCTTSPPIQCEFGW